MSKSGKYIVSRDMWKNIRKLDHYGELLVFEMMIR